MAESGSGKTGAYAKNTPRKVSGIYAGGAELRARDIVSDFLIQTENPNEIVPDPQVDFTDDIGSCEPLRDLMNSLVDGSDEYLRSNISSEVHFPYERYTKFEGNSPSKLVHDFEITSIYKDRESLAAAIRSIDGAGELLEANSWCQSVENLITGTGAETVVEGLDILAKRIDKLSKKGIVSRTERSKLQTIVQRLKKKISEVETVKPVKTSSGKIIKPAQDIAAINSTESQTNTDKTRGTNPPDPQTRAWFHPIKHPRLTDGFRMRYPDGGRPYFHYGADYVEQSPYHNNAVFAPTKVRVIQVRQVDKKCPRAFKKENGVWISTNCNCVGPILLLECTWNTDIRFFIAHSEIDPKYHYIGAIFKPNEHITNYSDYGLAKGKHLHLEVWHKSSKVTTRQWTDLGWCYSHRSKICCDPVTFFKSAIKGRGILDKIFASGTDTDSNTFSGKTQALSQAIDRSVRLMMNKVMASSYRVLVNDVSAKVEDISIDFIPGVSKYIPLEGENAPVAQSTGGRQTTVTIKLTEVDVLSLAKLSVMFRENRKDDTLLSMLMLARSVYKAGNSKNRLKYMYDYAMQQHLKERLNKITGTEDPEKLRLDEPIRLKNDIVNGLGMSTFIPTDIEVQSDPQRAEAYTVMLTFKYINLGYRSTESLKKAKQGTRSPLMAISSRLTRDSSEEKDGKTPQDDTNGVIASMSQTALRLGLSELVPIYILYKLNVIRKNMYEKSDGGTKPINPPNVAEMMDITIDTESKTMFNKHIQAIRDWPVGASRIADLVGSAGASLPAMFVLDKIGEALQRSSNSKVQVAGTVIKWGKWLISPGAKTLAGLLNVMDSYPQKEPNYISINIPSIVPMMMYEMIEEFIRQQREGTEEEWMERIATGADDFLADASGTLDTQGNMLTEDADPLQGLVTFPKPITVAAMHTEKHTPYTYQLKGFVYTMYTAGMGSSAGIFYGTSKLFSVNSGIRYSQEQLKRWNAEFQTNVNGIYKTQGEWFTDRNTMVKGKQNAEVINQLALVAAGSINATSIEVLKEMSEMYRPLDIKGSSATLGTLEQGAFRLRTSSRLRTHAIELIRALIVRSGLDILANLILASSKDGTLSTQISNLIKQSYAIDKGLESSLPEIRVAKELMGVHLNSLVASIVSGRNALAKAGLDETGLLSGMFVDGMYPSSAVRKGFSDAMTLALKHVEDIGTGVVDARKMYQPNTHINDPSGLLRLINPEAKFYTTKDIMKQLAPSKVQGAMIGFTTFIGEAIQVIAAMIGPIVLSIFSKVLLALAIPGANIIVFVIGMISLAWAVINLAMDEILGGIITIKGRFAGSRLLLSEWFAQRVKEGVNLETVVDICYRTNIWSSSIFDFNSDASDERETSYIDYPVVYIDGKPMAPDFYIYKIGFTKEAYRNTVQQTNDLMAIAKENYARVDDMDFDDMLEQMKERLRSTAQYILDTASGMIANVMRNITTNSGHVFGTSLTSFTKKDPKAIAYRQNVITAIEDMSNLVSLQLFGDASKEFCSFRWVDGEKSGGTSASKEGLFTITIYIETVKVDIETTDNIMLFTKFKDRDSYAYEEDAAKRKEQLGNGSNASKVWGSLNIDYVFLIGELILQTAEELSRYNDGVLLALHDAMPNTLFNMKLIKSLVGSSLRAIGASGMSLFRRQLQDIGASAIRKAAYFSSGYIFPTVKLYFIEEDDENFYMFDDLYSYASIIDVSVHMDRYTPLQTCVLRVTNLHGYLNNVLADTVNLESNFTRGADENAPLNAMMLRPGCKIKIQAGNTPILDEQNTIFTGRISNITFGDVTTIEAQSHGDVLLSEISPGQLRIYGDKADITKGIAANIRERIGNVIVRDILGLGDYNRPVDKIKDIIGYILTDLITTSVNLDDFSMNPGIQTEMDGELKITANNMRQALYIKYMPARTKQVAKQLGIDINVSANRQLFENIHLGVCDKVDDRWISFLPDDAGAWLSKDESAWDTLTEVDMLLPNTVMSLRPYDTRGTFVWGHIDGYYRYRRSTDIHTIGATMASSKLINSLTSNPNSRFIALTEIFKEYLSGGTPNSVEGRAALLSVVAILAYFAAPMSETMTTEEKRTEIDRIKLDPMDETSSTTQGRFLRTAVAWFMRDLDSTVDYATEIIIDRIGAFKKGIQMVYTAIAKVGQSNEKARKDPGSINIKQVADKLPWFTKYHLQTISRTYNDEGIEMGVKIALAVEYASEELLGYLTRTTIAESSAHKRISDYHIKLSGRDIIRNDIELNAPFNAVRAMYPPSDVELEKVFEPTPDSDGSIYPLHYSLKPWNWKVYGTYFKNANAFPTARTSVISMFISTTLTNLMRETYGGQIMLLGDPTIRDSDRILIWDENRDLFGLIGVRSHTFIFSQTEGCISVIEPDMIARTEYVMTDSMIDSTLWTVNSVLHIATVAVIIYTMGKMGSQALRTFKVKQALNASNSKLLRVVGKVAGRFGKTSGRARGYITRAKEFARNRIPLLRKGPISNIGKSRQRNSIDEYLQSKDDKIVKSRNIARDEILRTKTTIEKDLTSDTNISERRKTITKDIDEIAKTRNKTVPIADEDYKSMVEHSWKRAQKAGRANRPERLTEIKQQFYDEMISKVEDTMNRNGIIITKPERYKLRKSIEQVHTPDMKNMETKYKGMEQKIKIAINKLPKGQRDMARQGVDAMVDHHIHGGWNILPLILNAGKTLGYLGGIDWAVSSVRDIAEMWCINVDTQDNVVMSPMFFRGEPFIAGVDDITKEDGTRLGFTDLLIGRLSDTWTGITHSITDPINRGVSDWIREYSRETRGNKQKGTSVPMDTLNNLNPITEGNPLNKLNKR